MNRTEIEPFLGKRIKLVIQGNFCLTGTIDLVYEDSILFTTRQTTSLIRFDRIMEITPLEHGRKFFEY